MYTFHYTAFYLRCVTILLLFESNFMSFYHSTEIVIQMIYAILASI